MLATLISAAATCGVALVLGQGVLWLCGSRTWSWLAAPVGLAAMMLLAVPSLHAPGRATTTALLILLATGGAAYLMARDPALRPPLAGLAAGIWPFLFTLVPLLVAGRSGPLGVSISNDMAAHLLLADAHVHAELIPSVGPSYPLGPHAAVASIAGPLGIGTDLAFTGFTMAQPVLLGWTALALVRRAGWLGQSVVAIVVGMPFLVAAYYGQGAFKEIMLAALAMGFAALLAAHGGLPGPRRWLPAALLVAGMVSVYSYTGLLWPLAFFAAWLAGLALLELRRGGGAAQRIRRAVRAELVPFGAGVLAGVIVLVPQLPRVYRYLKGTGGGTGLSDTDLGNLVGRLSFWEGFGIWDNPDFRFPALDPTATGVSAGIVLVLAGAGAVWWLRRGAWLFPLATALCWLIWLYVDRTQSPYVAAKALVIFSPFVLLVAMRPIVERDGWALHATGLWRAAVPLAAAVLVFKVGGSSLDALRHSQVGPRDHAQQLQSLRPLLQGRATLFLGNDDFIRWELQGTPVLAPFIGEPGVPTRPEKAWQYGQAFDIDSVEPEVFGQVAYVIVPRDAAGSAIPPQLEPVRSTRDFTLYRRAGDVPARALLAEGEAPGAVLDCEDDAQARALSRGSGVAGVRSAGVAVPVPALGDGDAREVRLELPVGGEWDLVMPYTSPLPIEVSAPGLPATRLAANLDRPGTRFPVGRISVPGPATLPVRVHVPGRLLSSTAAPAQPAAIIAVPVGTERQVPLRRACGELVDYYLPAAG